MDPLSRERAAALDAADPLAGFRSAFAVVDDGRLYLDGNSLGVMPLAARSRLGELLDEWMDRMVGGWSDWIDLPRQLGDALAAGVLGARAGEVVVCDSVTVNLYKLACAVAGDGALVSDAGNFPTDRYVLEGIAAARGGTARFFDADAVAGPTVDDVARELDRGDVGLLVLAQVAYRSGALADVPAITALTRERGVPLIWDLCHSAGAVPVDLDAAGVDYAVGCTYKYLNAGPGAPAFVYVRSERQAGLRSPIWGWFGQAEQFEMDRAYDPAPGIDRLLAGTPPILALAGVEAGVRATAEAGVAALREKSLAQTELMIELHDAWLAPLGFELGTPRDPQRRGSHIAVRHPEAWPICRAMIERAQVVPDFRGPDSIRLATAPLYTRYADLWDALDRIRGLVERGEHRLVDAARPRVT